MRALGVDLGSRRIGIAVSDEGLRVASALTVIERGASRSVDHGQIASVALEWDAGVVVVGLPLSLSGEVGPVAKAVQEEVRELRLVLPVPVEVSDERFTTLIARRALACGGRRPALKRAVVDKMAAAAILQTWLDRQRSLA
jgi:putative Holliday junction resolvase